MQVQLLLRARAFTLVAQKCFYWRKQDSKKKKNTSWDESDSDISKSNGENKLRKKN